ncbi:MurR/RpiR family transcriptional regulator [Miniphocaeibacter halophilus]|uniref:MurR/RpiR family transcriptional regulator n=1 Tax=Miniphocaeibacter halophilus TaxID=2931922 RepID=A0AC61MMG4_9FIRM|nr:MurR/RpiR family transcriptional regulator [Miniphocaeibacter halophilus]QQK06912.1 MurR/RpiR family transcriptional regulator [Miniphocaeibacter halophilus]
MIDKGIFTKGIKLNETEDRILEYIFNNLENIEGKSVRELAKDIYTSPASIIRVSQKLGFKGYLEMYYFLINNYVKKEKENLLSSNIIDNNIVEQIRKIYKVNKEKIIFISATGFSGIIGEYLLKKLLVNGIRTMQVGAQDSLGIINSNLDSISFLITISKSGETDNLIDKIKRCKKEGIPTVLFTGDENSRAAKLSDYIFITEDDNKFDTQNMTYTKYYGNLLNTFELFVDVFKR